MSYFDDAKHLIDHCKPTLEKIQTAYNDSLHEKTIKPTLLIEIKNFMENLRSALDFTAHGVYDKYGDKAKNSGKIYFPYAWTGLDKAGFISKKIIDSKIPGLPTNRADIATRIESYQHFASSDNSWLPKFMDLNNENKHQQLTPQTRKETKQLNFTSGGAGFSLGEGAGIVLGPGAFIQIGHTIIPGGQTIDTNNPAKFSGAGKQEIILGFLFIFLQIMNLFYLSLNLQWKAWKK
jgi:hypothetical protein